MWFGLVIDSLCVCIQSLCSVVYGVIVDDLVDILSGYVCSVVVFGSVDDVYIGSVARVVVYFLCIFSFRLQLLP